MYLIHILISIKLISKVPSYYYTEQMYLESFKADRKIKIFDIITEI
jgi:hypothetical protein